MALVGLEAEQAAEVAPVAIGDPEGPYTTITVLEFNKLSATITHLRWTIQKARELLEVNRTAAALSLLSQTER